MKCLILANKIKEELFPLTRKVPIGLLSFKGKKVMEWILEELEAAGDVEYLVAACAVYEEALLKWKQEKTYKDKITIFTVSEEAEEEEVLTDLLIGKEADSDIMTIPDNLVLHLSLGKIVETWRSSQESLRFGRGNEGDFEELPFHFYPQEFLNTSEPLANRAAWKRQYLEDYCTTITSLSEYEDLQNGKIGERSHHKFEIQTFTQERYGDIFISRISMDRNIPCRQRGQAQILIHNRSQKELSPENTRLSYKLWLEEPHTDSYEVDKIPVQVDDSYPLPLTIQPGKEAKVKLDVKVPGICGRYFVKFDIEVEGQWLGETASYLLFPSVSFGAEAANDLPMGALLAQPKIIFVGMPESANAGEHLEAAAMKEFVRKLFPDRPCLEYPARNVEEYWRNCSRIVHPDDLVFPYGSGFMGAPDKMAEEHFRRRTAASVAMPKIRLRMFISPTHQAFTKAEDGMEQILHSATAYGGTNYYLYGAAEEDYQFFMKNFEKTNVAKVPLLSFGKQSIPDKEPLGDDFAVVVCGGSKEGFLDTAFAAIDNNHYHRMFLNLDYNAYQPGAFFGKKGREYLMNFCCETIMDTKAVVTDNHYGLGYALMCNRPCVVYGETRDQEWFRDRDDVIFVERLEDIEAACKEILNRKGKGPLKEEYYLPFKRQISM